ncbi:MAG: hypothetical protein H0W64_05845 [Gammaproteobacteria bacterium]|nr:hypothetical protein [Gammaproteobacteria bacterium]
MLSIWERWVWNANSNFVLFFLLLLFSHLVYLILFRNSKAQSKVGYIPLALSMVAIVFFSAFNVSHVVTKLIGMEIIIIWLYLAANLIENYLNEDLSLSDGSLGLATGTWILGTIFPLILFIEIAPTLYGFILLQTLIVIFLLIIFFPLTLRWLKRYLKGLEVFDANIFLIVLNIQAVTILLFDLMRESIPLIVYQSIILFGLFCYVVLFFVFVRTQIMSSKNLIKQFQVEYVLLYAALALSGMAMINTHSYSEAVVTLIWAISAILFIIIETVDILRVFLLLRNRGRAAWSYHVAQWARPFAIAVMYAFSLAYYIPYATKPFIGYIVKYGQYIVIACFILQALLYLQNVIQKPTAKKIK